jgi:UPF0755 protein
VVDKVAAAVMLQAWLDTRGRAAARERRGRVGDDRARPLHPDDDWSHDPWDDADMVPAVEPVRRHTRAVKWIVWSAFAVVIALVLVAGATGWWYLGKINPGWPTPPVNFTVDEDDTIETSASGSRPRASSPTPACSAGTSSATVGLEPTPGFFQLVPGDHMGNVLGRLSTPPAHVHPRDVPRGLHDRPDGGPSRRHRGADVGRRVPRGRHRRLVRPQFLPPGVNTLEGLLFPDTYQVSNSESEAQVVERMVALMERVARQENLEARAAELGHDPYEMFIIASMIEREAKLDEDRPRSPR